MLFLGSGRKLLVCKPATELSNEYYESTSMWVNVFHILSILKLFTPPGFPLPSMPGVASVSVLWGKAYSW